MEALAIVGVGPTVDHSTYLGGSDIAAVVGLSPYGTALDVWARKTGRATFPGNTRTRAGNAFERVILELYAAEIGTELEFPGTLLSGITGATPDAIGDGCRVVQAKMVGIRQAERWGAVCLAEDGIPQEVLAQVHYESWHAQKRYGTAFGAHVVAQLGTEQRVYAVEIDNEFAASLVEAGERFWRDFVVTDRMPIVTGAKNMETLRCVYKHPNETLRAMSAAELDMALQYAGHRNAESAAKKAKEEIGARLCEAIGGDAGMSSGYGKGVTRATWKQQRGKIDWEACAKTLGATDKMAEQFRKEPSRTLNVYVKGDE